MDAKSGDSADIERQGQGPAPVEPTPSRLRRLRDVVWPRIVWGLGLVLVGTLVNWVVFALLLAKPTWVGCFGSGSAFGAHGGGGAGAILGLFLLFAACFPSVATSAAFVFGFPLGYLLLAKKRVMAALGQTAFDLHRSDIALKIQGALRALAYKLGPVVPSEPSVRNIQARLGETLPFWGRSLLKRAFKRIPDQEVLALYRAARASAVEERGPGPGPEALAPTVDRLLDRIQIDRPSKAPLILAIINLATMALAWLAWTLVVKYRR